MALDTYELTYAQLLLDCLAEALVDSSAVPLHVSLRLGVEVPFDLSQTEDLCCEGLAYVKINRVYPSSTFPNEDEAWQPCSPLAWAADLEMGILRCSPTGAVDRMVTDAEWTETAALVHEDAAVIRNAAATFGTRLDAGTEWVPRSWLPVGPLGACTGGAQIITVGWIPC